ncbi:MAG TPA: pyruvate kinase [Polyangia bacterium]|jgi:pyruvate kinase|nr:pyruvate kinase [Polyangia bacterium]
MSHHNDIGIRRAKIVCTLGPASDTPEMIHTLIDAGMDVARLNFSHGTHEDHARRLTLVRQASEALGKPVAVLQDLCGPKIRSGRGAPAALPDGSEVFLVEGKTGDARTIAIEYPGLANDLHPGDVVRLDDGRIVLRVSAVHDGKLTAIVEQGETPRDRMGVNLPSRRVRMAALTEQDKADLLFGLQVGVDYVALSFVKRAEDLQELRAICERAGRPTPIVAKIETPEAVENLHDIVVAADAVMVARGDLGVELSPERVPVIQKEIIGQCRLQQKPVIVATEMLQSMIESTRPTRAEASDVAAAVFDGADAVMLSAETASGKHPLAACAMMSRIILEAEHSRFYAPVPSEPGRTMQEAIAHAACEVALELGARVLVAFTTTGGTPRLISKARPRMPIIAFSSNAESQRRLALYWGVVSQPLEEISRTEDLVDRVSVILREQEIVAPGECFIMAFGAPVARRNPTNSIRVVRL